MLDFVLFGALPYIVLVLFVGVSVMRYRKEPFTFSSLSSQFLESKKLFWGSVPFHLGILTLFFGHLVGLLFPGYVMLWNGTPVRLFILEATALAAALLCAMGLLGLVYRRITSDRLRSTTTVGDIATYIVLFGSVITGLWVATSLRWGSAWYVHTAVPYLKSLLILQPDIQRVAELPFAAKAHIVSAFVLIGVFSFTRLVHALVAPVPYLWRPTQLVIWNRRQRRNDLSQKRA